MLKAFLEYLSRCLIMFYFLANLVYHIDHVSLAIFSRFSLKTCRLELTLIPMRQNINSTSQIIKFHSQGCQQFLSSIVWEHQKKRKIYKLHTNKKVKAYLIAFHVKFNVFEVCMKTFEHLRLFIIILENLIFSKCRYLFKLKNLLSPPSFCFSQIF